MFRCTLCSEMTDCLLAILQRCVCDLCSSVNTPIQTNACTAVTALNTVTLSVTCGEGETLLRHSDSVRQCSVPV